MQARVQRALRRQELGVGDRRALQEQRQSPVGQGREDEGSEEAPLIFIPRSLNIIFPLNHSHQIISKLFAWVIQYFL